MASEEKRTQGERDLAALEADTAARAHAATHPDLDAEDAAAEAEEWAAIASEAELPEPVGLTPGYLAGLRQAARVEPEPWPKLATLSLAAHAAIRTAENGRIEVRRRLPDGSWERPEIEPAPTRTWPPMVIGSAPAASAGGALPGRGKPPGAAGAAIRWPAWPS